MPLAASREHLGGIILESLSLGWGPKECGDTVSESGCIWEAGDSELLLSGEFTTFFKREFSFPRFFLVVFTQTDCGFVTVKQKSKLLPSN